jgi:urease subunit gamma/beta
MLVIEGQFPDGTRLITVYDPITPGTTSDGPDPLGPPGAVITPDIDIELNVGVPRTEVTVTNTGDRAIQVSSHFPFAQTNAALAFDRAAAAGRRLDIPAGTTVRFEPGLTATVQLIPFPHDGARIEARQVDSHDAEPGG